MCPCVSEVSISLAYCRNRKKAREAKDEGVRGNWQELRSEPWARTNQVWLLRPWKVKWHEQIHIFKG